MSIKPFAFGHWANPRPPCPCDKLHRNAFLDKEIEKAEKRVRDAIADEVITSFFPPGEPTRDTCVTELLKALKKKREAGREIEFWERKLREAAHG